MRVENLPKELLGSLLLDLAHPSAADVSQLDNLPLDIALLCSLLLDMVLQSNSEAVFLVVCHLPMNEL